MGRDIIATGVQLAYTHNFASRNPTQALWKWTLTTQIIECITIITSCVPYLRPLLESIPSGMYVAGGTAAENILAGRSKDESYGLSNTSSSASRSNSRHKQNHRESGVKRFMPTLSFDSTPHSKSASGLPGGPRRTDGETDVQISAQGPGDERGWETESDGSQAKIIKTTVVSAAWEDTETNRRSREMRSESNAWSDEIEVQAAR